MTLTKLTQLTFTSNLVSGNLSSLARLTQLTVLKCSNNANIVGDLRPLASLVRLTTFWAASCGLTGDLSPLAALTALTSIDLRFNALTGYVSALQALTKMAVLALSSNSFSGDLAPLANMTSLVQLLLDNNKFSGTYIVINMYCIFMVSIIVDCRDTFGPVLSCSHVHTYM